MSQISTTEVDAGGGVEDVDRFYRALADSRRRIAIRVLDQRASLDLDELAEAISRREPDHVDPETVKVSLVHQHVSLMEAAGIVTYDADDEEVMLRQSIADVLPLARPPTQ